MHDDFLPLEGGIEVGDDADAPRLADAQRLGRRAVLAACAERALLELRVRRRVELGLCRARPFRPRRCDRDAAARQRISSKIRQLVRGKA
jgi:hypothetical protein